jgi:hypothetical protein
MTITKQSAKHKPIRGWAVMSGERILPVFYGWKPRLYTDERAVPVEIRLVKRKRRTTR